MKDIFKYIIENFNSVRNNEASKPKSYQNIQQNFENGVFHLIKEDKLYIFRTNTQENYGENPALEADCTKHLNTKEDIIEHTLVVSKLFNDGKIKPEVMLSGRTATAYINKIHAENAKLPNRYEYEQVCIVQNYAKLHKYPIETSIEENGRHKVQLTTHYGVVNALVAQTAYDLLLVSHDNKKNVEMDLVDFLRKFYYDKTKDKVNDLVTKFKIK